MATEPTTGLTVTPASPQRGEGILFEVTGPAGGKFTNPVTKIQTISAAKIVVTDDEDRVRVQSPLFTQKNRLGVPSQVVSLEPGGSPSGGYVVLSAVVRQPYNPANPESAADRGYNDDLGPTAHIVYAASDDDVATAVETAWGTGVRVSGGLLGVDTLVFDFGAQGGLLNQRKVDITVDDHLVGGTLAIDDTATIVGGAETVVAGGPFLFGPVQLDPGTYSPDVVYAEVSPDDPEDPDVDDSLLTAPHADFTVT